MENNNNNKQGHTPVITEDPLNVFRFENDWNVGVFDCCEDCKLSKLIFLIKYEKFSIFFNSYNRSSLYILLLALHVLHANE